jgi:hypothetical protein
LQKLQQTSTQNSSRWSEEGRSDETIEREGNSTIVPILLTCQPTMTFKNIQIIFPHPLFEFDVFEGLTSLSGESVPLNRVHANRNAIYIGQKLQLPDYPRIILSTKLITSLPNYDSARLKTAIGSFTKSNPLNY